jgi:hypothetical protein
MVVSSVTSCAVQIGFHLAEGANMTYLLVCVNFRISRKHASCKIHIAAWCSCTNSVTVFLSAYAFVQFVQLSKLIRKSLAAAVSATIII